MLRHAKVWELILYGTHTHTQTFHLSCYHCFLGYIQSGFSMGHIFSQMSPLQKILFVFFFNLYPLSGNNFPSFNLNIFLHLLRCRIYKRYNKMSNPHSTIMQKMWIRGKKKKSETERQNFNCIANFNTFKYSRLPSSLETSPLFLHSQLHF